MISSTEWMVSQPLNGGDSEKNCDYQSYTSKCLDCGIIEADYLNLEIFLYSDGICKFLRSPKIEIRIMIFEIGHV